MKHKTQLSFFIISSILLICSCAIFIPGYSEYSSAKKYYQIGDYDSAVHAVSRSLQIKADNQKGISLLEIAYPLAVTRHQSNIDKLKTLEDASKWPDLVYKYEALESLGNQVELLKSILKIQMNYNLTLAIGDYSDELKKSRPLAADYHYTMGMKYQDDISKKSQKKAAINFKLAQKFVANYKNAQELYEETRAAATITLLIRPFNGNINLTSFIRNQMMMKQTTASKEFLRIITREQLRTILNEQGLVQAGISENNYIKIGQLSGADHILSATIVTTHRPVEKISEEQIKQKKEVVISKEKYVDSTGVEKTKKIKGEVKATVNYYKKSTGATLNISYQITDINNGETIFTGNLSGKENFFYEWATYDGDKRALSDRYKRLVNRKEIFAPSIDNLTMKIAKSISAKFQRKVANHYSN
ncbi:MAG: hypothetical protein HVK46_04575 [Pelagibacteraceae bacterium]|jgi:hypothetical protein|nr:hypothetical protein [Pelagibacteraceae bacterium]MBO6467463.1 hypothetical protein [Pelagibacteraceae bacterium]MDP6033652.1 CsgG/HfaB family protein [Candidatus Neomarinimicrobiota bacterium]HJL58166.1 CsgG/HfaB family protein [Alphaproteobacteria bacterium]